jgi:transcriptional regulator with XRE-family HTH domain
MSNRVAENIRMERLRRNLSQQNIADELGITVAAYSNIERGITDLSVSRLYQIAGIFQMDPTYFLNHHQQIESDRNIIGSADQGALSQQIYMLIQEMERLKTDVDQLRTAVTGR